MELKQSQSLSSVFVRSTILWRTCLIEAGKASLPEFGFEASRPVSGCENPPHLARVEVGNDHIDELVAIPTKLADGERTSGILIFITGDPPNDWTHLVVTKPSRQMSEGTASDRRGSIHAKFGGPIDLEQYLQFREWAAGQPRVGSNLSFAGAVKSAKDYIFNTCLVRCVVASVGSVGVFCEYEHFKDEELMGGLGNVK